MRDSKRRSVKLTDWEKKDLKILRLKFNTAIECAEYIGINRGSFDRVYLIGSGSEEVIRKIREAIN